MPAPINADDLLTEADQLTQQQIPDEMLLALLRQANDEDCLDVAESELLDHHRTQAYQQVIRAAWSAGYAAALGHEVTVGEMGDRLTVGDRQPAHHAQDVDALLANVARSLASARDNDDRAEAVDMLLCGWYAAWPDSAVTDPHTPLAGELVRLLAGTPAPAVADDVLAAWVERAIDNPWSIVGDRLTQPGWWETTVEHAARAVMAVVRDGGRLVCERCDHTIRPTEAVRAPLSGIGLWEHDGCPNGDPSTDPAAEHLPVSSTIAVSSRFARAAAGEPDDGRDWVRLRTGSGRQYEGHRSPACPGDGVTGHEHDVRCIDSHDRPTVTVHVPGVS